MAKRAERSAHRTERTFGSKSSHGSGTSFQHLRCSVAGAMISPPVFFSSFRRDRSASRLRPTAALHRQEVKETRIQTSFPPPDVSLFFRFYCKFFLLYSGTHWQGSPLRPLVVSLPGFHQPHRPLFLFSFFLVFFSFRTSALEREISAVLASADHAPSTTMTGLRLELRNSNELASL